VRACAITGFGVVSPVGIGRDSFFGAIRSGARASFDPSLATTLDGTKYPAARVAEVPGFDPTLYLGDKGLRSLDRLTKLLLVAARLALHDAGLKRGGQWAAGTADTVGLVVSNAYGSLEAITELNRVATLEDARYINPSRFPLTVSNSAAGYVSIWEDLRALNVTVSDGNPGALDAIACAEMHLSQGRAAALLVGGAEAMSEALFLAFKKLGAIPTTPEPGGLRLGEAAALVVLEIDEAARARGAPVLGRVVGYGTAFVSPPSEASHVHPSPQAVERAIGDALADAGIDRTAIDVVVSGIAGLPAFDAAELVAIGRVLGEDTPVTAPKLAWGETLGAGSAMGILGALALLRGEQLPVAPGAERSPAARADPGAPPSTVLVVSMGYYGNASAIVVAGGATGTG